MSYIEQPLVCLTTYLRQCEDGTSRYAAVAASGCCNTRKIGAYSIELNELRGILDRRSGGKANLRISCEAQDTVDHGIIAIRKPIPSLVSTRRWPFWLECGVLCVALEERTRRGSNV